MLCGGSFYRLKNKLRKKIKEYCPKGICFALEMNNKTYLPALRVQKHLRIGLAFVLCCFLAFAAKTQNDTSLLLRAEQLTDLDVRAFNKETDRAVIRSATRTEEQPGDLPFSTWVITSDDILRYGFVTLADVLKAAPGIRVSQPGNAVEGETFMMRGLTGNQYVKILINDVPVKPSGALGMPIGAQLPIRAAERVEVMYGPGAGIYYGDEACAGVVNIIIKETERPIFTRADLGFGRYGYNSLDLTFGGKVFRGKNVLRFSLYGSSTVRSETDIYWNRSVLDVRNSFPKGFTMMDLTLQSNYRGGMDTSFQYTLTSPVSHESRLFGIQLRWRGVSFIYHRMLREDRSSLGLNPLAVSFSSPGTYHRDKVDTYALSFWKNLPSVYLNSTWSVVNYLVGNNSSTNYIFDQINLLSFIGNDGAMLSDQDKQTLFDSNFVHYNSNARLRYARSTDVRIDNYYRVKLWKKLWLTNGIQTNIPISVPMLSRYVLPPRDLLFFPVQDKKNGPFLPNRYSLPTVSGYANLDWQHKKFRAVAGVSNVFLNNIFSPRIALMYRIDSSSVVYANAVQGYKQLHPYQRMNTYNFNNIDQTITPNYSISLNDEIEKVRSAEIGYRRKKSEVAFFYQNAFNLIRDGYLIKNSNYNYTAGFAGTPGLSQVFYGAQMRLVSDIKLPVTWEKKEKIDVRWRNEFFIQYARGKEWFGYGLPSTNEVRNFPRWITQFRTSVGTDRVQVMFSSNRQTSVLSKAVTMQQMWQRNNIIERYPKFRTWDAMFRFYLNKNFVLYFNITNAFNRESYGLDATGGPDDMLLPLQQRRLYRFGINYNMN